MSIEHLIAQSADEREKNNYTNCVYCCRRCNTARSNRPRELGGRKLLDPTKAAWGDHFQLNGDSVEPKSGSSDAAYTHEAYDIDSPEKIRLRKVRRTIIEDHLTFLTQAVTTEADLLSTAILRMKTDPTACHALILAAQLLRDRINRAMSDLAQYEPIPSDAARECRCDPAVSLSLPAFLESQINEIGIH